jgi:hypothetical protein
MWKCSPALRDFHRASHNVAATQREVLRRILQKNRDCEFGQRFRFRDIRAASDFQSQVPPSIYDDYAEAVGRIANGERGVLTSEPITLFEPTSGTNRGEKLIPYTRSLRSEFQRTINAWVADLLRHRRAVRRGRSYWSISPAFRPRQPTAGGIPIGFEDDTQYLGLVERPLVNRVLAVPPDVARLSSIENFRYCTLLHLVGSSDLSFISIWSPTFLTTMLRSLEEWAERICRDLEAGSVNFPDASGQPPPGTIGVRRRRRASEVRSIFASSSSDVDRLQQLWPKLVMISCWADAAAARQAVQLQQLFPSVEIQPKGLLATECVVSFPLASYDAPALAIHSHFFEFKKITEDGEATGGHRLAHELDRGSRYAVIVTTGGGLYRYQLGDIVEIVGYVNDCPLIRFVGRTNQSSDLVGEKLNEPFVRECLDEALAKYDLSTNFAMITPVASPQPHYCLYLQGTRCDIGVSWESALADELQRLLERNPHYHYAIALGQLGRLHVRVIPPGGRTAWEIFAKKAVEAGRRIGDIKPTALDARAEWSEVFEELVVSREQLGQL